MEENNHPPEEEIHNPHVRYEPVDINPIFLTKFGIAMAFLLVVILFGVWGIFEYFLKHEAARVPPATLPLTAVQKLPPEPRLQPHPAQDMQDLLAAEKRLMDQYAWIDPDKGIVRIPVDRAMDLVVKNGLPVWPAEKTK